ncbi:type 1 glutamine amidotransferase domain-containing protein [Chitinophaga sp.]|uniref:type 1 glutamine amidotransferase domain-containing protein n=1 Tax=Chitinophaga sp. TaxID=1869181 RepID=UPI0031D4EE2E
MKILLVTTTHHQPGNTGLWLDTLAAPYYAFIEAGADVQVASPKGGRVTLDPTAEQHHQLLADQDAIYWLEHSLKLSEVSAESYDSIFIAGGRGAMWDLVDNKELNALLQDFNRAHKPIAAVAHGVAGLCCSKDKSGMSLLAGRNVTAIANEEEKGEVPFPLETRLKEIGAVFYKGEKVVSDENIITGHNAAAAVATAEAVIEQLESNYYVHFRI